MSKPAQLAPEAVPSTTMSRKSEVVPMFRNYGYKDHIKNAVRKRYTVDSNWIVETYAPLQSFSTVFEIYVKIFYGENSLWKKFIDELYSFVLDDDEFNLAPEIQAHLVDKIMISSLTCYGAIRVLNIFHQLFTNHVATNFVPHHHWSAIHRIINDIGLSGTFVLPASIHEIEKLLKSISFCDFFIDISWIQTDLEGVEIVTVDLSALSGSGQKRSSEDVLEKCSKRPRKSTYPSTFTLGSLKIRDGDTWRVIMKSGPLDGKELFIMKSCGEYQCRTVLEQDTILSVQISDTDQVKVTGVPLYRMNLLPETSVKLHGPKPRELDDLAMESIALVKERQQDCYRVIYKSNDGKARQGFVKDTTIVQVY